MTDAKLKRAVDLQAEIKRLKPLTHNCGLYGITGAGMDRSDLYIVTTGEAGSAAEKIQQALSDRLSALEKEYEEL